jgi:hypothetical protein
MPYDDGLAHRLRRRLRAEPGIEELELCGGLGIMRSGNLVCAVLGDGLVALVGPDAYEAALASPHARPFDFTGREMRGWVVVDPPGVAEDEALDAWLDRCLDYVGTLPPK